MISEAKEFFEHYNKVFDSGDMEAFSKLFCEPFLSVRHDGSIASMPTNKIAQQFFQSTSTKWKQEGYRYFSTKDIEVYPIGKSSILVSLTWQQLDVNRTLIKEWRQSYNLLNSDGAWKVIMSTVHL